MNQAISQSELSQQAETQTLHEEAVAPWLENGDPVWIPEHLHGRLLPSRRFPQPVEALDAQAIWREIREPLAAFADYRPERCDPKVREDVETVLRRVQRDTIEEDTPGSDAVLLRLVLSAAVQYKPEGRDLAPRFLEYLIARRGLQDTLDLLLMVTHWNDRGRPFLDAERVFHRHLAAAPATEWEACLERLRETLPKLSPGRQIALAALLADAPELVAEVAGRFIDSQRAPLLAYLLPNLCDAELRARIVDASWSDPLHHFWRDEMMLPSLVRQRGSEARHLLIPAARDTRYLSEPAARDAMNQLYPEHHPVALYHALSCIGTPDAIATLIDTSIRDQDALPHLRTAVERWPLAAIASLAEALSERKTGNDKPAQLLRPHLNELLNKHLGEVERLLPWLTPKAREVLQQAAAKFAEPTEIATAGELPPVLISPPWQDKKRRLPTFWQPQGWSRPRLRDSGKALPLAAVEPLGQMMTFPLDEGLYAGLRQVRDACTPQSLAEFAWDCFSAWHHRGAPSKENWAFAMLGHLGNDDTVRRLTPLIHQWRNEGEYKRANSGLDRLVEIGSDLALMYLDEIARKSKSSALKERVRQRICDLARNRGMSEAELQDRLVPTFDLDERGTLELDFGPRQFTVGFDEHLKPYVRDESGKRLAELPKARKDDDAAKSQAATERFKQLKQEVRSIASAQTRRLETAMCNRQRWQPETFRPCLAEHPLLRHLVQRLVWSVHDKSGNLLQCFRVAADGSVTDADDNPLELPQGNGIRYGLPHPLELPAQDAAAFVQLFADYQLMQPFQQLGRDTYRLSEAELASGRLERWDGRAIDGARLYGLVDRGWRRDSEQEYGKPVQAGAPLDMTIQLAGRAPRQTLQSVAFMVASGRLRREDLANLDPIAASELIRDLEYLCA